MKLEVKEVLYHLTIYNSTFELVDVLIQTELFEYEIKSFNIPKLMSEINDLLKIFAIQFATYWRIPFDEINYRSNQIKNQNNISAKFIQVFFF